MARYIDIGRKIEMGPSAAEAPAVKSKRSYSSFDVPEDLIGHFENMEVGDECEVRAKLCKSGHQLPSPYGNQKKPTVTMEIRAIAVDGEKEEDGSGTYNPKKHGY